MAEDTTRQLVMDLKDEFNRYKESNNTTIRDFKKETRDRFDVVEDTIESNERETMLLRMEMTNIAKSLEKIDGNTVWMKRALITTLLGAAGSGLVAFIINFAQ